MAITLFVIAGLVPAIHRSSSVISPNARSACFRSTAVETWIAGTSPAMTRINKSSFTVDLYEFLTTPSFIGSMKTHIEFKSDKFPSYGNDSEGVNWDAGIYGKRLAEYLTAKLAEKGILVDAIDEDWGWYLSVKHSGKFEMAACCASHDNPEMENPSFHVFVRPDTPTIRRWFKKIDVKEPVEKLASTLYEILANDAAITELQWVEPDNS